MVTEFVSLAIIALTAAVAPAVARIIPRQAVPEVVILIVAGAILGPNMTGLVDSTGESIQLLSDLGCAFLFLLAGYEIDPKSVVGRDGRHGLATWGVAFLAGIVFVLLAPQISVDVHGAMVAALLLTTTALGTLMPILKDRGLQDTRIGNLVISYGTWGELAPVLGMAVLLSTRSTWVTAVILLIMAAVCVFFVATGKHMRKGSTRLYRFLESKAESNSQTFVRIAVLILIVLVAFSALFDLDIVLGAFAAGFVLRAIMPEGSPELESKLNGMAYGFFVPLFFVVSGCKIDLAAVAQAPLLLVAFIVALILVRCVPIVASLTLRRTTRRELSMHNRLSVAFYCTTALPLIVAITSVAVDDGMMSASVASVLVAAGAITVFLMPFLGALVYRVVDAEPISAIRQITHDPHDIGFIIHEHVQMQRDRAREYREQAIKRLYVGIDAIENPQEREEVRTLTERHGQELAELVQKQRGESLEVYKRHHDGHEPTQDERRQIVERIFAIADDVERQADADDVERQAIADDVERQADADGVERQAIDDERTGED